MLSLGGSFSMFWATLWGLINDVLISVFGVLTELLSGISVAVG